MIDSLEEGKDMSARPLTGLGHQVPTISYWKLALPLYHWVIVLLRLRHGTL
jgi:hypothetical protein